MSSLHGLSRVGFVELEGRYRFNLHHMKNVAGTR